MKTFTILFTLYLNAVQTEANQTLFATLCDKVIARLRKYHAGFVDYEGGSPAEYELDPGWPFKADILLELENPYDPINYTEEELKGLLSGDIDFNETGYFKDILRDVDFILDDEQTIADDEEWSTARNTRYASENAFNVDRSYRIDE